jgi:hypothetical protein
MYYLILFCCPLLLLLGGGVAGEPKAHYMDGMGYNMTEEASRPWLNVEATDGGPRLKRQARVASVLPRSNRRTPLYSALARDEEQTVTRRSKNGIILHINLSNNEAFHRAQTFSFFS